MTYETRKLIDMLLSTEEFDRFKNDSLVDVFRVWDCDTQNWIPNSPLLLRFESDDVVVRMNEDEAFEFSSGPVDTYGAVTLNDKPELANECLCWLRLEY